MKLQNLSKKDKNQKKMQDAREQPYNIVAHPATHTRTPPRLKIAFVTHQKSGAARHATSGF